MRVPSRATDVVDVFACPECGEEVEVRGFAPGRQVRCARCETLVEVPYFRRHRSPRRMSRTIRRLCFAGTVLVGVMALAFLSARLIGSKVRDESRREFDALIAQARDAEATGAYGDALRDAIAAIKLAEPRGDIDLDRVRIWRDGLSRRELSGRLDGLEALDPESALGEALILAERVKTDEALSAQRDAVFEAVSRQRVRDAGRRMAAAHAAFEASRCAEALDHCVRTLALPGIATDPNTSAIRADATRLIRSIAGRAGVRVERVRGTFGLGTEAVYRKHVVVPIVEALRDKGYVIPDDPESLGTAWNGQTGYHLSVSILESQDGHYLQSANRTTRIDVKVDLFHGDERYWYTSASGRTRIPALNMSAFEAGRVASSPTATPQAEHRLFDDAVNALRERLGGMLANAPKPAP